MNRKAFVVAPVLLFGAGLTTALPGMDLQAARAAGESVHVDWATDPGRHGQTRISGYIRNSSGTPVDHVQLVIDELDASGRVVSSVFQTVDDVVPSGDRAYFEVQVPGSASYRVGVESYDTPQAP